MESNHPSKVLQCIIPLIGDIPRIVRFIETGSRPVVAGACGEEKWGVLVSCKVSVWEGEKSFGDGRMVMAI